MLFSVGRGKRKEQVEAKRKLCKENGGIISVGGSQAQKLYTNVRVKILKLPEKKETETWLAK